MERLERGVAIQFLNREPLESPVSKYGTAGTGVAFLNVSKWFLNMKPLERRVAIQFLNKEPLEPIVSKYGTVGRGGGCKHFLKSCKQLHCDFKQWILNRSLELPSLVKSMHAQTDLGIQATPYKLETKKCFRNYYFKWTVVHWWIIIYFNNNDTKAPSVIITDIDKKSYHRFFW